MKKKQHPDTPVYCLDDFSVKAGESSFYIETLQMHLARHPFVSKPHKHDFYLILYITKGAGDHTIDFKTYPVTPGSIFLMTPGQVHSWNLAPETDGYIIFFQRDFYQMQLQEKSLVEFPFFHSLHSTPYVHATKDTMIDVIVGEMYDEFTTRDKTDLRILRTYLDLLLLKLARLYPQQDEVNSNTTAFKLRKLEQLIEKHFIRKKQPSDYADLMNLSPSYLNNICKQNLGKTLSDLIQDRIILEARRRFAYTDLSVAQVSHQLNFSEPSYFIRFFKKKTGVTPERFKQSLIGATQ